MRKLLSLSFFLVVSVALAAGPNPAPLPATTNDVINGTLKSKYISPWSLRHGWYYVYSNLVYNVAVTFGGGGGAATAGAGGGVWAGFSAGGTGGCSLKACVGAAVGSALASSSCFSGGICAQAATRAAAAKVASDQRRLTGKIHSIPSACGGEGRVRGNDRSIVTSHQSHFLYEPGIVAKTRQFVNE